MVSWVLWVAFIIRSLILEILLYALSFRLEKESARVLDSLQIGNILNFSASIVWRLRKRSELFLHLEKSKGCWSLYEVSIILFSYASSSLNVSIKDNKHLSRATWAHSALLNVRYSYSTEWNGPLRFCVWIALVVHSDELIAAMVSFFVSNVTIVGALTSESFSSMKSNFVPGFYWNRTFFYSFRRWSSHSGWVRN